MSETLKIHTFIINDAEAGQRLDLLLSRRYEQVKRTSWQERIRKGQVLVEGKTVRASRRLKAGEEVRFEFLKPAEPEITRDFSILHEDEDLLVIDKPTNLPVHPSGVYHRNTLHALLKEKYGDDFVAHFAHRLDRETSGVLVMARNRAAAATLSRSFRANKVGKEYLVLVEGDFPDYLDAKGVILYDKDSVVRKKRKFVPEGEPVEHGAPRGPGDIRTGLEQEARTEFHLEKKPGELSLLRAVLHTGRTHQIRCTLCSLGYPVVGDRLYGVDEGMYLRFIDDRETDEDRRRLRLDRTALHCLRMRVPHPSRGDEMVFESPVPGDIRSLIGE